MNQAHLDVEHEHDRIDNALDGTPKDPALSGLQESVRAQIIAIVKGEISSKTMSQLQRFCASVGQALVTLEKPDALVRDRFQKSTYPMVGMGVMDYYDDGGSLAPSPASETYGANTSRGLIESAAKIGKDIVAAQAEAQRAAKAPTITEMITAFAVAKNAKLPKATLKLMEKQIADAAAASSAPTSVALLPQAIPVPPPKRSKRT
jgi:hypothetical protein